jgi:hypothetical protein
MTITNSGAFYLTERDIKQNDTAIDLIADALKGALFTNSITTPNFDTNTAYAAAPFNANEVGTPAGGITLTSVTIAVSSGTWVLDAADTAWGSQSIALARAVLIHDDTITTPVDNPALYVVTFGADFSVTSGVLTIQWHVNGIVREDLTP